MARVAACPPGLARALRGLWCGRGRRVTGKPRVSLSCTPQAGPPQRRPPPPHPARADSSAGSLFSIAIMKQRDLLPPPRQPRRLPPVDGERAAGCRRGLCPASRCSLASRYLPASVLGSGDRAAHPSWKHPEFPIQHLIRRHTEQAQASRACGPTRKGRELEGEECGCGHPGGQPVCRGGGRSLAGSRPRCT